MRKKRIPSMGRKKTKHSTPIKAGRERHSDQASPGSPQKSKDLTAVLSLPIYQQGQALADLLDSEESDTKALEVYAGFLALGADKVRDLAAAVKGRPVEVEPLVHGALVHGPASVLRPLIEKGVLEEVLAHDKPITAPLTTEQLWARVDTGKRLVVVVAVDFNRLTCSSDGATMDGLDAIVDKEVWTGTPPLGDRSYAPVGVTSDGKVLVEVNADARQILDELDNGEEEPRPGWLTPEVREAVADATGNDEIEDYEIEGAVEDYEELTDRQLAKLLRRKETEFDGLQGECGGERADEIDSLRIALAIRKARRARW